jgi:O-antigen/teichoic acid export membrane protein
MRFPLQERLERALRATERYTKTDMVYLVRNGGWLTAANIGIAAIAFFLSVAFAHFVPKDAYGTYRFLLSIFWTLTAFSLTGIPPALIRAVAKGQDSAYGRALRTSILWSSPMALIALALAGYYFVNGNLVLGWGAVAIALVGPFMQGAFLFGPYLEGKREFRANALAGLVLNLVPAGALLASMFFFRTPLAFLVVYLVANVATGFAISFFVLRSRSASPVGETGELSSLSKHFSAMNVLSTISQQIDRLLVYHYLGAVDLAVYTFATAVPDQLKSIFNNASIIALPKFVSRPMAQIRTTLGYRLAGFTALAALAACVYILLAPYFFRVFFPAYSEAIVYSQLYALALIPVANMIPVTVLEAHAAKRELYIFNIASPVFVIALLVALVSTYGLLGAILARIVSRFFNLALGYALTLGYAARTRLPS